MSRLRWDDGESEFVGLSSVVLRLDAAYWEALGARFLDDDDLEFPQRVATATVTTQFDAEQRFAVVDDGDVTTLLVGAEPDWLGLASAALLLELDAEGVIKLRDDVLQTDIGAARPTEVEPVGGLVALDSAQLEHLVESAAAQAVSAVAAVGTTQRLSTDEDRGDRTADRVQPRRRPSDLLVVLGGGEPALLTAHSDRTIFVTLGFLVASNGLFSGTVAASFASEWLGSPLVIAVLVGLIYALVVAALTRPIISSGMAVFGAGRVAAMAIALLVVALSSYLSSEVLLLRIFHAEIDALPHHDSTLGFFNAVSALNELASSQPSVRVIQVLLPVMALLIFVGPLVLSLSLRNTAYAHVLRMRDELAMDSIVLDMRHEDLALSRRRRIDESEHDEARTPVPERPIGRREPD